MSDFIDLVFKRLYSSRDFYNNIVQDWLSEMNMAKYKPVKYEIIRLKAQKGFKQKLWKIM